MVGYSAWNGEAVGSNPSCYTTGVVEKRYFGHIGSMVQVHLFLFNRIIAQLVRANVIVAFRFLPCILIMTYSSTGRILRSERGEAPALKGEGRFSPGPKGRSEIIKT